MADISKEGVLVAFQTAGIRRRSHRGLDYVILLSVVSTLSYIWTTVPSWLRINGADRTATTDPPQVLDWQDHIAKPYLDYEACYGGLQCALLELPMDYWNDTTNATISLAVVRNPAVVPVSHPQYGGAILLNPGGPGGSGIGLLLAAGEEIRAIVDANATDDFGKYFDLISFDPRGVGLTKPSLACFEDEGLDSMWMLRMAEEGLFESSDAAMGRLWSMFNAKGQSCSVLKANGTADIKKYVSTAYVARDMLEIVERHGEWREKEAERLLTVQPCHRGGAATKTVNEVPYPLKYQPGEEKLQYWGYSYGTYLGSTYAAMFPERVERLALDGVVDAYNYNKGLWSNNLIDTEKVMDWFYYNCARAGYPACALANKTHQMTADGVKQRTLSIVQSLYHSPLPIFGPNPEVVTYSDVRTMIFYALYSPMQMFPAVATVLSEIEAGNGSPFLPMLQQYHASACTKASASRVLSRDSLMAIACTDSNDQTGTSRSEFEQHYHDLLEQSPTMGGIWSTIRMYCVHYHVRAMHRFEGPWASKTSHPILFIGNTMDPVTPNAYAHKMAKGFAGAVVLTQESAGHCSLSAFSRCTVDYIHNYFQTGAMPPIGTICKADEMPFGTGKGGYKLEDAELEAFTQKHRKIADSVMENGGGFIGGLLKPMRQGLRLI